MRCVISHTLNPTFDGSEDIGGADADFILGDVLIDIKTSIKPAINANYLWQLLGYVLLDYSDCYHIDSIGLYMSRQGSLFQWSLEEAVAILSPGKPKSIAEMRKQFRQLMMNLN